MTTLFKAMGYGELVKGADSPVTVKSDPTLQFPPKPPKYCSDGTTHAAPGATADAACPVVFPATPSSLPLWPELLKYCLVGTDATTGLAKPVTEYADMTAFNAERLGIMSGQCHCSDKAMTVYRKGIIRIHLATPTVIKPSDWIDLSVDAATSKLHLFSGEVNGSGSKALSLGRPAAVYGPDAVSDVLVLIDWSSE